MKMNTISIRTVIIALIFLLSSCGIEEEVPEKYKSIMRATGAALGEMEDPYELGFSGIGFSVEHETGKHLIRNINIFLNSRNLTIKNDSRKILVEYAELLVENVNKIEEAKNYLNGFPYKIQDVDVVIFLGKYQNPLSPNIKSIELRNGIVTYETVEPGEDHQPMYEKETIEEALRIVHKDMTEDPQ